MKPSRIQLRRTKGWRKPEDAVVVSRPSKWGNPFNFGRSALDLSDAVESYILWISGLKQFPDLPAPPTYSEIATALRGKDLCCWCPLDKPCHADVLLELANR